MKLRPVLTQLSVVLGATLALVGCASPASSDVETDAVASTIEAVIHVERTATQDATTTSVSAKFLRVLPEDAERAATLVGTRVVLPAEGDCVLISSLSSERVDLASVRPALKGSVELVDVGDLMLRASSSAAGNTTKGDPLELQLTPRAFPDVGDLVSGVFYTQPDVTLAGAAELPAPGAYVLSGTGASQVEPFAIDTLAPATPTNVRVGGQALAVASTQVKTAAGKDLAIDWDVLASDADGLVYIDVQAASPYRCTFKDIGSAVVPSEVLSGADAGQQVTLSVHRVREESVRIDLSEREGQESALVRFDFARTGKLLVE